MKLLLRIGFVVLIAMGLTSQFIRSERHAAPGDRVSELNGRLQQLDFQTEPAPSSGMLLGRSRSCPQPIHAASLRMDGAENEIVRSLRTPDYVTRFIYLGTAYATPRQAVIMGRYMWASVLFNVGLRRDRPGPTMAFVALPRECPALTDLDWGTLSP